MDTGAKIAVWTTLVLVGFLVSGTGPPAWAEELDHPTADPAPALYVAMDGDDTGDGTRANPFKTIQHAIDMATDGDQVLVMDGTYTGEGNRDIDLMGKAIVVRSYNDDPTRCVIDCQGQESGHSGFRFVSLETRATVLRGFRITNAAEHALYIFTYDEDWGCSPTIENCELVGNLGHGAYIGWLASYPRFVECRIEGNGGGGIVTGGGSFEAVRCTAADNGGHGFETWTPWFTAGTAIFENCDSRRNGGDGFHIRADFGGGVLTDCKSIGNEGAGILGWSTEYGALQIVGATIKDNDGHGIELPNWGKKASGGESPEFCMDLNVSDCEIMRNGGDGIYHSGELSQAFIGNCRIYENGGKGISLNQLLQSMEISECRIDGNGGDGIGMNSIYFTGIGSYIRILDSTLDNNRGHGVNLYGFTSERELTGLTVAGNDSTGIRVRDASDQVSIGNCLTAGNGGLGMDVDDGGVQVICSDSFGNRDGNWSPELEPAAVIGELTAYDPLFCDADSRDYTLSAASPCADVNSDCGQIGAMGVGCAGAPDVARVSGLPGAFGLLAAYPNPFNPVTKVTYELPQPATVDLRIYDVKGRLVRTLVSREHKTQGPHEVVWRGRDDRGRSVATGVYFCRITAGVFSDTERMVLVK